MKLMQNFKEKQKNEHIVLLKWTKGHANNSFNEKCDEMAKKELGNMKYNFKDVDMNFLESISDSFNFYLDDFCEAILNKREGYPSFSKETLKQLLILNNNIS